MTAIQFIEQDGRRAFAVVPIEIFEQLEGSLENAEDVALFDAAKRADDGFRIPGQVAAAILNGTNPIKAWREHRGLTQEALSSQTGISKAYLCQIETGKRTGAIKTLRAIAQTLEVSVDEF